MKCIYILEVYDFIREAVCVRGRNEQFLNHLSCCLNFTGQLSKNQMTERSNGCTMLCHLSHVLARSWRYWMLIGSLLVTCSKTLTFYVSRYFSNTCHGRWYLNISHKTTRVVKNDVIQTVSEHLIGPLEESKD